MKGTIFDIQRFSVHDGPGIRTTVFMKGCPLKCRWCHNPEGLSALPQLQFIRKECIECGRCGERKELSDAEKCPTGALKVCGREICEEELLEEILRDRDYYGENGGVTFSGGECMVQYEFVASMLRKVKGNRISTVIDTSGFASWDAFKETFDCCDLYLYDIKAITPELHKEYTGADNKIILENLRRLTEAGKNIWIRIPVIPDVNDSYEELSKIAAFIRDLDSDRIKQVRLMPYHTLGKSKYESLGLKCLYNTDKKIDKTKLTQIKKIFNIYGVVCEE